MVTVRRIANPATASTSQVYAEGMRIIDVAYQGKVCEYAAFKLVTHKAQISDCERNILILREADDAPEICGNKLKGTRN